MLTNFLATLIESFRFLASYSRNRMPVVCRVAAGGVMLQLPFDVVQESTGSEAEKIGFHPGESEFFLPQCQPLRGLFRHADSTGRLEATRHSGFLRILANGSRHHKSQGQRGVCSFFAG